MTAVIPTCRETVAAVPGAARVHGGRGLVRADAVVVVDAAEHARRLAAGLGAVPDVDVLQALMCLPLHAAVPVADLGEVTRRLLRRAPAGCVDWLDGGSRVRRGFVPAASVPSVVVRGSTWRPALRRAAAFEPFAARVVLLTRRPRRVADIAWEADVDGAGLWVSHPGGEIEEIVAPQPYVSRYVKPARWRFAENAYGAWLARPGTTRPDPGSTSAGPAGAEPLAAARPIAGPGDQLTF